MLDMKKNIDSYSDDDFIEAAKFIRSLPKYRQQIIIDKLIEKIHANKNILAHVNWNNINKFEFNGVIYAGNVSGRWFAVVNSIDK